VLQQVHPMAVISTFFLIWRKMPS